MKAADIAAYFTKKIAKPIAFDVGLRDEFYFIEPTAVSDNIVHALVTYRYTLGRFDKKVNQGKYVGEAVVPFEDGDAIGEVLNMALAVTRFDHCADLADDGLDDLDRAMKSRFLKVLERLEVLHASPTP